MMMRRGMITRAVCVTAGAVLALTACGGKEQAPATPTLQPAPIGTPLKTAAPSAAAQGGCALASQTSNEIPQTAPPVDQWVDIKGVGVPTSKTFGPGKRDGDLFTCYQHSPTGALFAVAYAFAALGRVDGAQEILLDKAVRENLSSKKGSEKNDDEGNVSARLEGYRFESYTGDRASITIAANITAGNKQSLIAMKVGMVWEDNQWRITKEGSGDSPVLLGNLDGYTPWRTNG